MFERKGDEGDVKSNILRGSTGAYMRGMRNLIGGPLFFLLKTVSLWRLKKKVKRELRR